MPEIKDADLSGMCKPQAGASWWSGAGGPEDDLKDIIDALKENLAASQAREQGMTTTIESLRAKDKISGELLLGLAMVVEEMRAYVQQAVEAVEEWNAVDDTEAAGAFSIYTMPELLTAGRAILAADPVERGGLLMQAREGGSPC